MSGGPRLLATVRGAIACDAFRSRDDGRCHAIVLSDDGRLTDVVYDEGEGIVRAVSAIGAAGDARDVTAFWSDVDEVRNVISVSTSGEVSHFRQQGADAWTRMRRRAVPDALRVAGYDRHHHGIVLTAGGRITDEPFHGVTAAVQQTFVADTAAALAHSGRAGAPSTPPPGDEEPAILVATIPGALDIAALWADGQSRFVIAADERDAVVELGYGVHQRETRRVLAPISGVRRLSACYLDDPAVGRCVVALTRAGGVHELRYGADLPGAREALTTRTAEDIACFPSADGGVRIVLASRGDILELAVP